MTGEPRDYLAAERTFLAWIRTGLSLMGFGFVVARFGLFLRVLQVGQPSLAAQSYGLSFWFGTALIVIGVIVNLWSARQHVRLVRALNQGAAATDRPSSLALGVAVALAVIGLAMAIYLISVGEPTRPKPGEASERATPSPADAGVVTIPSHHPVDQTVANLKGILEAKGVKLFALIDHSGEAEGVGIRMRPTKLLIFGNPRAGTPLMLASPTSAIDLPLKILVWEDASGKSWLSYNSPGYLAARHRLPPDVVGTIAVVEALATKAAE